MRHDPHLQRRANRHHAGFGHRAIDARTTPEIVTVNPNDRVS